MQRIPKIIHYCWFGNGRKNKVIQKCMRTWYKKMPDYTIMEWNEQTFNIDEAPIYVKEAYQAKKYAFVSDYVRLYALKKFGGIYLDTDIEICKNFEKLLDNKNAVLGFQGNCHLMTSFIACIKDFDVINKFISEYDNKVFILKDGSYNFQTNPPRFTELFQDMKGLVPNEEYQEIDDDVVVFQKDYFSAFDLSNDHIFITENTYTIHHYMGTWENHGVLLKKIKRLLSKILGIKIYKKLKDFIKKILKTKE